MIDQLRFIDTDELVDDKDLPPVPGVDAELMEAEFQEAIFKAQEGMPEELKDTYELWATGDYSMEELARQFAVPIGTIRARVKRITRYLRRALEQAQATHVPGVL